jgi:hypothetical protein
VTSREIRVVDTHKSYRGHVDATRWCRIYVYVLRDYARPTFQRK